MTLRTGDFDYHLPPELIAQTPLNRATRPGCWRSIAIGPTTASSTAGSATSPITCIPAT